MNNPQNLTLGLVSQIFGDVSPQDVQRALKLQQEKPNTRLGQVMVKHGILDPEALDTLLDKQAQLRDAPAPRDVMRLVDYATERTRDVAKLVSQLHPDTITEP